MSGITVNTLVPEQFYSYVYAKGGKRCDQMQFKELIRDATGAVSAVRFFKRGKNVDVNPTKIAEYLLSEAPAKRVPKGPTRQQVMYNQLNRSARSLAFQRCLRSRKRKSLRLQLQLRSLCVSLRLLRLRSFLFLLRRNLFLVLHSKLGLRSSRRSRSPCCKHRWQASN